MTDSKPIFDRINELYSEYEEAAGKKNVEDALQSIKMSLIIETCKIYAPKYLRKNHQDKNESVNFPDIPVDEIIECIARCLKSFLTAKAKANGQKFSQYLCTSVKNKLSSLEQEALAVSNGGMGLSDNDFKILRKIKQLEKTYIGLGKKDEEARLKEIASFLEISEEEVRRLKEYSAPENNALSLNSTVRDSETELMDIIEDFSILSPEDIALQKISIEERFAVIDSQFIDENDENKPYLSALLTHRILTELKQAKTDMQTIKLLLKGRAFSKTDGAKKVRESFFSAGNFILQQEVASWSQKDKTDASRTMRSFLKKLKCREEAVNSLKT